MPGNGSILIYLGASEPYVGDYDTTETYELHSISCERVCLHLSQCLYLSQPACLSLSCLERNEVAHQQPRVADSCNADGVAIAAYNTPENLNCLSPSLSAETFLVLEHAARDDACKVLICETRAPAHTDTRARAGSSSV